MKKEPNLMHEHKPPSILTRDPFGTILFGVALVLVLFIFLGESAMARSGNVGLLRRALIATAVFAVAGILLGLTRTLRKSRSSGPRT